MNGKVKRAHLGLAAQSVKLSNRMIGANQLKTKTGIYIFDILADMNVHNNSLKIGDIIIEFGGKQVATVDNLHKYLDEGAIGKSTTISILREGRKQNVTVIPGELK